MNDLLDVTDAFVREAQASLAAAGESRFHRVFLEDGMPGAFRAAARQINQTRTAMAATAHQALSSRRAQQQIADTASDAAQIVAAAAVELSASADVLSDTTSQAVDRAHAASDVVEKLNQTSDDIGQSLASITQVTAQTKMLALNATIEAVRAGEAGKAFAVVAQEVKFLADQTALINQSIRDRVESSHQAAHEAVTTITQITALIHDMDSQVAEVGRAANGGEGVEGLAQMAVRLHRDTSHLAEVAI